MLKTKINVNLGTSKDCLDTEVEMQKVLNAVDMGAEAYRHKNAYCENDLINNPLIVQQKQPYLQDTTVIFCVCVTAPYVGIIRIRFIGFGTMCIAIWIL
mgnify:CR=1 FL=1